MRSTSCLLALLGLLAACSGPTEVASVPPGVSYRVTGDNVADASLRADRYCGQYARRAVFDGMNQSGNDRIAVFSCR